MNGVGDKVYLREFYEFREIRQNVDFPELMNVICGRKVMSSTSYTTVWFGMKVKRLS